MNASVVRKIVTEMMEVAPAGQQDLEFESREALLYLTDLLLEEDSTAECEYQRFIGIRDRMLDLSGVASRLTSVYGGKTILITGGTGCIGSALIPLLIRYGAGEIYSFSSYHIDMDPLSGYYSGFEPVPGVVYLDVDIMGEARVRDMVDEISPDVIFHCAAQRSPWLAEREIQRTVMTNVVGTRNVLRAARAVEVPRFIHTSTGKAMRYYTADVYAASKKLSEWLVQCYAAEGRCAGAARFTHVVDNAVVLEKIQEEIDKPDGVIRCHGDDIEFYVQSAAESAQLLMLAGMDAVDTGLQVSTIRCLGDPVRLLSMILGKIRSERTESYPPVYFSGYDRGYERGNPPGLYDPRNAADLSPLINAVEARSAHPYDGVPEVDQFSLSLPTDPEVIEHLVNGLELHCRYDDPFTIAARLADAVKVETESMFSLCPEPLFKRLHSMAAQGKTSLPTTRVPARYL